MKPIWKESQRIGATFTSHQLNEIECWKEEAPLNIAATTFQIEISVARLSNVKTGRPHLHFLSLKAIG